MLEQNESIPLYNRMHLLKKKPYIESMPFGQNWITLENWPTLKSKLVSKESAEQMTNQYTFYVIA